MRKTQILNKAALGATVLVLIILISSCGKKWTIEEKRGYNIVTNNGGHILGYSPSSGVTLLEDKGFVFKDLNRNGALDKYEDWRLSVDERAKDLALQMSVEQIAGLMLYSAHQAIPSKGRGPFGGGTYDGKSFDESGAPASNLTDQQMKFLREDNLRHVLITSVESPAVAAQWNNNMQAFVEGIGLGIPGNTSSDPRHRTAADAEFNAGAGGNISMWPTSLGLAATFRPEEVKSFGDIASKEYRALGIATALSPQIDLATEPRWARFSGTFGEDPQLDKDMVRAYVDGFQSSQDAAEISGGWGYNSVNTMVKHWPGGGPEEGGRDAHFAYGKYAVYPGDNLADHLIPFTEGAFKLDGATGCASAVMPYYTISDKLDKVYNENVGNSYSTYLIKDLLRGKYGYEGVVCTDWGITKDNPAINSFGTTSWGAEHLSVAERHYKIIMAGVDQFGGNNDKGPVIEAYNMGVEEFGEEFMRKRFEQSAVRLLKNIFRAGLFENPYLNVTETENIVGNPDFMAAGYEAQLKSVVMLKNMDNTLPVKEDETVYVPKRYFPATTGMFGFGGSEPKWDYPVNLDIVKKYAKVTDNPNEADYALVYIESPDGGSGYSPEDVKTGGTGYVPISLQYKKYKAVDARKVSIAGGDPLEDFNNRSYKNKTTTASNSTDLDLVLETKKVMGDKPVIIVVNVSKPMVFAEFEKEADAIMVSFGVQAQAILDVICGKAEPSGLLPFQMPANMKTVEEQLEDVPRDMECHKDEVGNIYDFAFGLNWSGIINDARVKKYK
ncbi:glycoside hydrolase family 3 C-terminal domain-containing protein [Prolixibacteraceae bacterium Z1-6]|uniref:beta-glucosidase n=1 Tax=Draconibacterium aestuarii TaxID=2998507 RepID=A0A9X3FB09_9BACT|nr:glycoside hydrolase family 3 C-terminal domain-containing protein [Prolixibacteraceae bacterium Z1-6]